MSFQHSAFQHNAFQTGLASLPQNSLKDQPNPVLRVSFFATCLALTACLGTPNILPLTNVTVNREAVVTRYNPRQVQQWEVVPNYLPLNTVVQGPFGQSYWPNPYSIKVQQPDSPPALIGLQAAANPAFIAPDLPNPLIRSVKQIDPVPDLLTSTLNQATNQTAFQHPDQPNPVLACKVLQIDPIPDLLTSTLNQAATHNAFENYDFPNPIIRKVLQVDPIPDLLTSTLNQAVNHAPFIQTDQPNPVLRTRTVQPEIPPSLNATTLTPFVTAPFDQTDWPNPVRAVKVQQPEPPPDLLTSTLNQAATHAAFNQTDQPNPVLRTRTVQPEPPPNVTANLPTVATVLRDGVVTRYCPRNVFQWDQPANRLPIAASPQGVPFGQDIWPNPQPRQAWLSSQQLHVLHYVPTSTTPTTQDDWPNPITKFSRVHLVTESNRLPLFALQVTQRLPCTTPVYPRKVAQPEQALNRVPLVTPPLPPFKQLDHPNPVRTPPSQFQIRANTTVVYTPPLPPFYQTSWPNPIISKALLGYWVFQFDRLNISLQPAGWNGINDAQTPGWVATGEACTWDSTVATFDSTVITFDTDCAAIWGPVNEGTVSEPCTADATTATADAVLLTADTYCVCTADLTPPTADSTVTVDTSCGAEGPPAWVPVADVCTIDTTTETIDTTLYTLDTQCGSWTDVNDTGGTGWTKVLTNPAGVMSS